MDHFLEHSLTYALIEIADGEGTAAGLGNTNPRVRRACMMALDQMDPRGPLGAEAVAREMSSPDLPLRETAEWIASRHAEWGDTLAETLKRRLMDEHHAAPEGERISRQLAKLAGSEAIQKVMADELVRDGPQRQIVLAGIGMCNLKSLPTTWVSALSAALNDPALVSPTAAALRRLPAASIAPVTDALLAAGKRQDLAPMPGSTPFPLPGRSTMCLRICSRSLPRSSPMCRRRGVRWPPTCWAARRFQPIS